jgi:succinate dehydrogenase/fumarate reductase cytochrome b subunit (b558 family)
VERESLARRLFSLSGVVPLGFFLLEHTWVNASALRGQTAYVANVEALARIPLLGIVEVALVFIPLAYHAAYGLWMMREGIPSGAPPHGMRALSIANRCAATLALAFIVWHLFEYRVPSLRGVLSPEGFYSLLVWRLSSVWHGFPTRAMIYMVGIMATAFHFVVSGWSWAIASGLLSTRPQRVRAAWTAAVLGSVIVVTAASTVISLSTGVGFTPPAADAPCEPKADSGAS